LGANKYRIVRRIYAEARRATTPAERDSGIELGGRVEGLLIESELNLQIVLHPGEFASLADIASLPRADTAVLDVHRRLVRADGSRPSMD